MVGDALSCPMSEQYVIGALARFPELMTGGTPLTESDFADPINRRIYSVMQKVAIRNHIADFASITDEMAGLPDGGELMACLMDALKIAPAKTMYGTHVRLVKDAAVRRRLTELLKTCETDLADKDADLTTTLDKLSNASKTGDSLTVTVTQVDAAVAAMTLLDARTSESPYTTGLEELDSILAGGLHRGELTVIGARPAVGKTAFALWLAVHIAQAGKQVVYISREMQANRLILRQVQSGVDFDPAKLRTGGLTDGDWTQITGALNELATLPITYIEHVGDIERMRAEIRAAARDCRCDVVIIDYLQLIRSSDKQIDRNEYTRVSYVSRVLKELTLELNIPVVALAQINRTGDREKPEMSELKGSGSIEQDADNVILMHRTKDVDEAMPSDRELYPLYIKTGYAYLIINVAKQRDGVTGSFPLLYNPARQTYIEIARGDAPK